jgi:hypothetical protein
VDVVSCSERNGKNDDDLIVIGTKNQKMGEISEKSKIGIDEMMRNEVKTQNVITNNNNELIICIYYYTQFIIFCNFLHNYIDY